MAISSNDAIYTINAYRVDVSTVSTWLRRLNTSGATVWHSVDVGLSEASLTTDASNNVIVSGRSGNSVYMKRYDPDGHAIGAPVLVSSNASLPRETGVAVDAAGHTYVTWEDKRSNYGYDYEVYANRIGASGERAWATDKTVNEIDLAEQQHSRTVAHPSGGILVVWDQDTSGGGWVNLLANRIDAGGTRSFSPDVNLHAFGDPDVDGDGMGDEWEIRYFGCSLDCAVDGDSDRDGVSNYREYIADTVPTNVNSRFRVAMSAAVPGTVFFDSSTSRTYRLESATNLCPPVTWTGLGDAVPGDGGVMSLTAPDAGSPMYYRVKVEVR